MIPVGVPLGYFFDGILTDTGDKAMKWDVNGALVCCPLCSFVLQKVPTAGKEKTLSRWPSDLWPAKVQSGQKEQHFQYLKLLSQVTENGLKQNKILLE